MCFPKVKATPFTSSSSSVQENVCITPSPGCLAPPPEIAPLLKVISSPSEQRRFAKTTKLRAVALTLTYRDTAAFSPKHISSFLDRLRRALKRAGHSLPYAWVLECAGQPHYHSSSGYRAVTAWPLLSCPNGGRGVAPGWKPAVALALGQSTWPSSEVLRSCQRVLASTAMADSTKQAKRRYRGQPYPVGCWHYFLPTAALVVILAAAGWT